MSPEQAAFCVLHPNHPAAKALMQRDWDMIMLVPENKQVFDRSVKAFADEVDRWVAKKVWRDVFGVESR